ncbi:MAG: hypothetical protein ABSC64_02150 [Candidatus Korobacteraceae bacterium]|jgi:hypothetical protein
MVIDPSTLAFYAFIIGAFLAYVIPLVGKLDPTPQVTAGVTAVMGFMALLAAAVTGGNLVVPAFFGGVIGGWLFVMGQSAIVAVNAMKIRLAAIEERLGK